MGWLKKLFSSKKSVSDGESSKQAISSGLEDDGSLHPVEVDEKYGYINRCGDMVIERQFSRASSFKNGIAEVTKSGKTGYINTNGDFMWPK